MTYVSHPLGQTIGESHALPRLSTFRLAERSHNIRCFLHCLTSLMSSGSPAQQAVATSGTCGISGHLLSVPKTLGMLCEVTPRKFACSVPLPFVNGWREWM